MTDTNLGAAAGDIFAKAFTLGYETGRTYIPAGGMALTAEQVAALKRLMDAQPDEVPQGYDLLEALFPATEPAEDLRVHNHGPFRGARQDGYCPERTVDGRLRGECMAPAVPAEEETKAEECAVRLCVLPARHSGVHADHEGLRWNNPASSPVVPAPTETGPWETWQEVPAGVEFRGTFGGGSLTETVWVKRDGILWHSRPGKTVKECQRIASLAPFVAAGEGAA